MGAIEALRETVTHIEQQTAMAETMAQGLGNDLAELIRTITGL